MDGILNAAVVEHYNNGPQINLCSHIHTQEQTKRRAICPK